MSHKASFFPAPPAAGKQKNSRSRTAVEARKSAPYTALAASYDAMMGHVDFSGWARYLCRSREEIRGGICRSVLDLGCGTGQLLLAMVPFLPPGCRLEGMDRSAAMLRVARKHVPAARFQRSELSHLRGLKGPCDWLVSTHDALNYLTEPARLKEHFSNATRLMSETGLYSFDLVTQENIEAHFAGQSGEEDLGEVRILYRHEYNRSRQILTSELDIICGTRVATELHVQRYYSPPEVEELLRAAGLRVLSRGKNYGRRETITDFYNYHVACDRGT
ncbi:MAG: methyltransferase domain-containing protein [Spirochaetales bacterium]|nr:methyltransferase domain-containing protein [Spirochaetales bacterium]